MGLIMGNQRGLGFNRIYIGIFLVSTAYTCMGVGNISVICFEQERLALLKFKESVGDESMMLSSWVGNNCCRWERIHCNSLTGHVERLHLRGDIQFTSIDKYESGLGYTFYSNGKYLSGYEMNSSLVGLRHLRHLDLSGNDFFGSRIPEFIGSFKQLTYLNLSNTLILGIIPHHIGNLSTLKVLDLSSNEGLMVNDMSWTFGLSSLELLDLSSLNLSRAHNWNMVLYMVPSLKEISLSNCGLSSASLGSFLNSSRILSNIKHLDLGFNSFKGPIPKSLSRLRSLQVLDLCHNRLTGPIPTFLGNLTKIDLSFNQLSGSIPESFGKLAALTELYLESNRLTGPIPTTLGRLVSLQAISLYSNLLNGTIPYSFRQLEKLQYLDISNNSLEGVVFEAYFGNLSMLKHLDTSSNTKLMFNISREWIPPFQLVTLRLNSCNIVNEFPEWLRNQSELKELVLSNTTISGPLPTWLRKMPIIPFLDLSHNKLTGPLTNLPNGGNVGLFDFELNNALFLQNNFFNESIPRSLCRRTDLGYLNLSRNRLTGKILKCFENLQGLLTMIVSSNQLCGIIPGSIALNSLLVWLQLNDNNFIGELPREFGNLGALRVLDVGDNKLSGNIPTWIGEKLTSLVVFRLHKNNFTGRIPRSLCKTSNLQILDVAYNSLTGSIPRCLGELNAMVKSSPVDLGNATLTSDKNLIQVMKGVDLEYTKTWDIVFNMDLSSNKLVGEIPVKLTALSMLIGLNLSNNHLSGAIPDSIGNMRKLESLDFSGNELSGRIPPSMAALTFLNHLNLSHNNLSGRIPTGSQLQTLTDPSIYVGNKDLCGVPLPKNCSNQEGPATTSKKKYKESDEPMEVWFYLDIIGGFATGFWGVIGVLLFKKQWRQKLFTFAEETMDKIYVVFVVRVAKMKREREAA